MNKPVKTIWKYPLQPSLAQFVMMPEDAELLAVQAQGETLCLWALVSPDAPLEERTIEVLGTGHQTDEKDRRYIGTAQMHGGKLVWHVFEWV